MPKGIIVMYMPETCWVCDCWIGEDENDKGSVCCLTGTEIKEYVGKMTKPGDCPIKPIPEEKTNVIALPGDEEGLIKSSIAHGWNMLRAKILYGGEDE